MTHPFDEFILKIATRCNLNCDYCYEYNLGDDSWKAQPKFMTLDVAEKVAVRIREHVESHQVGTVSLLFHGGEPLLVGLDHLNALVKTFRNSLEPATRILFGIQTNGTLLRKEHVTFFERERFGVGVSVDGPPPVNDAHRYYLAGGGSGNDVSKALALLQDSPCFSGILCVINASSDPLEVWDYLSSFLPLRLDFLLPHGTWDRRPPLKGNQEETPYADWLIPIFDRWFNGERSQVRIRCFEEILRHALGGKGTLESLGLKPATLLVIAANGDYEGVDTLKAVLPGTHVLGMNSRTQSLDQVLEHPKVASRQAGASVLSDKCQACHHMTSCGGGYVPHRFSAENGFKNPSVFCTDLYKLIGHIRTRVFEETRAHAL